MSEKFKNLKKEGQKPDSEERVHKSFLSYFKKNQNSIRFPEKLEAMYEYLTKGKLSTSDKALVIGALLYFINPIDAIPDLTPYLGFIDDIGVIGLVFRYIENRSLDSKDRFE